MSADIQYPTAISIPEQLHVKAQKRFMQGKET